MRARRSGAAAGVIFFNNVGYLGMCGHGTIGLVVTLAHLGRIEPASIAWKRRSASSRPTLHEGGEVTRRERAQLPHSRVRCPSKWKGTGRSRATWPGAATGSSWSATTGRRLALENVEQLTDYAWRIRQARARWDHRRRRRGDRSRRAVRPATVAGADSKNFVLCPGKAYDRSPCGTGTSAKLACLAADGKLREGEIWRQESIVGSVFEGSYRKEGDSIIPVDHRLGVRRLRRRP